MSSIKFNGIFGGEYVKATINKNDNDGIDIFINGMRIPDVFHYRVILNGDFPQLELAIGLNEVDGSFISQKIELGQ